MSSDLDNGRHRPRIDAFVSYSHVGDERTAAALRDALHAFAKRWNQFRALRIFLDQASLSAAPDLWSDVAGNSTIRVS